MDPHPLFTLLSGLAFMYKESSTTLATQHVAFSTHYDNAITGQKFKFKKGIGTATGITTE